MNEEVAELPGELLPAETTGEGDVELEESPTSEEVEAPPKPKGVQKRIDELTSNWRSAERDRDYWRELAVKAQQGTQPPETPPEPVSTPTQGKPALESYESYDAYVEALADWKYEQRAQAERQKQEQERQQQTQAERTRSFQQRAETVRVNHPDFDDVVGNPSLPISQAMADAAYSSEKGPEILYHLGQNPQLAEQLYRLSPVEAAMAIGRLEATLSRPSRNQTSAPDPITPVSGTGSTPNVDPDSMTVEQWKAWRNKQIQR